MYAYIYIYIYVYTEPPPWDTCGGGVASDALDPHKLEARGSTPKTTGPPKPYMLLYIPYILQHFAATFCHIHFVTPGQF